METGLTKIIKARQQMEYFKGQMEALKTIDGIIEMYTHSDMTAEEALNKVAQYIEAQEKQGIIKRSK